jgi:hypothetical protein
LKNLGRLIGQSRIPHYSRESQTNSPQARESPTNPPIVANNFHACGTNLHPRPSDVNAAAPALTRTLLSPPEIRISLCQRQFRLRERKNSSLSVNAARMARITQPGPRNRSTSQESAMMAKSMSCRMSLFQPKPSFVPVTLCRRFIREDLRCPMRWPPSNQRQQFDLLTDYMCDPRILWTLR